MGSAKKTNLREKNISVVWHEAIAGRKAEEITPTFVKALKHERDCKSITYWLNNCASQNKNWCLFTVLASLVNSEDIRAEKLNLSYFETGHTFMSADFVHHGVEEQMRRQPGGNVNDYNDFCDVVRKLNQGRMEVLMMENNDFRNFRSETSATQLKRRDRPLLADIVCCKFIRGLRKLLYKTDYRSDTFDEFDLFKKTFPLAVPTTTFRDNPRGVPECKKTEILHKLCPLMPPTRRAF